MSGGMSSAESSGVVNLLRPLFEVLGIADQHAMSFVVRKCAHFSEYAILLGLATRMAMAWFGVSLRSFVITYCVLFAAPCVDETIQRFVPGRAGMPTDVLIDMSGGMLGMLVTYLVVMHSHKRKTAPRGFGCD